MVQSEPLRNRDIDLHRLLRYLLPLGRIRVIVQCLDIVDTVSELHEDYPQIARHRKKCFFERLQMPVLSLIFDLGDFHHAFAELTDFFAEFGLDLLLGDIAVLYHVMQQTRLDGLQIGFHIHEEFRRPQGMYDIRLSREPGLSFMLFRSIIVCFLDERDLVLRKVFLRSLDNLVQQDLRILGQGFVVEELLQDFDIHTHDMMLKSLFPFEIGHRSADPHFSCPLSEIDHLAAETELLGPAGSAVWRQRSCTDDLGPSCGRFILEIES